MNLYYFFCNAAVLSPWRETLSEALKKQIILLFSLDNDHEYLRGTAMPGVTGGLTQSNKQPLVLLLILSHSDHFP